MTTLSFSQKKLVIDGDTIIGIYEKQMIEANKKFVELKVYKDFSDSLISEQRKMNAMILSLKSLNSVKTKKTQLLESNLILSDSINSEKEKRIAILNKSVKSERNRKVIAFFEGAGAMAVVVGVLNLIF